MEGSIQQLFTKYLQGQCTSREIEALMSYFDDPQNELLLKQMILARLNESEQSHVPPDLDARLSAVHHKVQQYITKDKAAVKLWRKWKSIAAAAAVLLIVGVAVYFTQKEPPAVLIVDSVKDIKPGKNSATLTLANGTKVLLNNTATGQVASQMGSIVAKTASGKIVYDVTDAKDVGLFYNTLSTANGELYTVVLPDGTTVVLNAASSIKYPTSFTGLKERKIELAGEAYFAVKHNDRQPFRVISKGQELEDIGTEFNVNTYANEPGIKTTLVSGSAKVSSANMSAVILITGQQSTFKNNSLKVNAVDPTVFIAWKEGLFAYKNTSLEEVMRQVARWYNVEIAYADPSLRTKRLTGSVSRYDTVDGILKAISYTAKVRFKIERKTITVLQGD